MAMRQERKGSMSIEAMKLALEALEPVSTFGRVGSRDVDTAKAQQAITAITEALAQPEQEPVVWMYQDKSTHEVRFQKHMRDFVDHGATYETPLYTTPPQRQWVGLTDREVDECYELVMFDPEVTPSRVLVYKAVEAKLKQKNGYTKEKNSA
jgi:hypothetical protein